MNFYCYSEIDDATIESRLGEADYSYYFVLKAYVPLLEQLGTVSTISQIDNTFIADCKAAMEDGQDCCLLAFAPPHKIPFNLPCPVIPVFAWEYSSIPSREFIADPQDSWCDALEHFGKAITHSSYAKQVIKQDIREAFPIESIPAPKWDSCAKLRDEASTRHPVKHNTITLGAVVIDSWDFAMTSESITPASQIARTMGAIPSNEKSCNGVHIKFGENNPDVMTVGFYPAEGWGTWSKTSAPWIMLPIVVSGKIHLKVSLRAHGNNVGRDIRMQIGEKDVSLDLGKELTELEFDLDIKQPSNFVSFSNIDPASKRTPVDPRTIGIGLSHLYIDSQSQLSEKGETPTPRQNAVKHDLSLNGVVYTSILNPRDGRKNWEDILTAFCLAFREQENATLLLKMTCKDISVYLEDIFTLFCQLQPFKCRVVIVHGYISNRDYETLISSTSYIVNASRSEGQCLPLMEYMSCGVPAIAPDNTAMADYINKENAFIVDSSPEPHYWPHDPQQLFTTLWYRPSWESLYKAYVDSYAVAQDAPDSYAAMSKHAWQSQYKYCSSKELLIRLETFLKSVREN